MKKYTVTKQNFLEWYFNTGADDEQQDARTEMGRRVIDCLLSGEDFHCSVENIFNNEADLNCMPIHYLEEFLDDDSGIEVDDIGEIVEINLI